VRADGAPIENIVPSDSPAQQQAKLRFLREQDGAFAARLGGNDAVESTVRNYELAARMQSLVPDVLDDSRESKPIRDLYGLDDPDLNTRLYARQCLRARRLVENGVRFVQVNCPYGLSNGTWTSTAASRPATKKMRARPTVRWPRSLKISNNAACSRARLSSGRANSVARRTPPEPTVATIIRRVSAFSSPAAA